MEVAVSRPITPFSYIGGKVKKLKHLLPVLETSCETYIEPFCGSCAVILNRPPAQLEIINDSDLELMNFFEVLRDEPDKLLEMIKLTPYHRGEFDRCNTAPQDALPPAERARRFYVRATQCYTLSGILSKNWARPSQTPESRKSRAATVNNRLNQLSEITERLRKVHMECRDAMKIIADYPSSVSLLYADPPYLTPALRHYWKAYRGALNEKQHCELLRALRKAPGKVAISGYHSKLYDTELSGWYLTEFSVPVHPTGRPPGSGEKKKTATECVWTNYRPPGRGLL